MSGKLNWAAHVIPWGRAHVCPIYTSLASLSHPRHKVLLAPLKQDLQWWLRMLRSGHNSARIWDARPATQVFTDSSIPAGGAFYRGDWTYTNWQADLPVLAREHINVKELAATLVAARRWAHLWRGLKVTIFTDNVATVWALNNQTTVNAVALSILKELAELAIYFDFSVVGQHIPGRDNVMADTISRLHEDRMLHKLFSMLCKSRVFYYLHNHMSDNSLMTLSSQIMLWYNACTNLTICKTSL